MKKIVMAIGLFSVSLMALDWKKDLNTAFDIAKKEHKTVMVMVESSHCRWCKKMKKQTLLDATIQKRLENYILVKVMREDSLNMVHLPTVHGVPTIFFLHEDKHLIEDIVGYFNISDFASYIDDVEKKLQQ